MRAIAFLLVTFLLAPVVVASGSSRSEDPAGDDFGFLPTCHDPRIDVTLLEAQSDGKTLSYTIEVLNKSKESVGCAGVVPLFPAGINILLLFGPSHTQLLTMINPTDDSDAYIRLDIRDGAPCAYHLYRDDDLLWPSGGCEGQTTITPQGWLLEYPLVHTGEHLRDNWDFRGSSVEFVVRAQSGSSFGGDGTFSDDASLAGLTL